MELFRRNVRQISNQFVHQVKILISFFTHFRNFVESLDFSQKIVKLVDSNYLVESNHRIDGNLYFYENVFGALDAPGKCHKFFSSKKIKGEYFINLTESRIYYIPLPDEDIQTASFELGILSVTKFYIFI